MATAGSRREAGGRTGLVLGGLVVLGAISFVVAVAGGSGTHAWAVFLANLLFWSGLSAAGPAIAGIFELTDARWAARLRRIATTTVAFMPVSFVLFLLLMLGLSTLYPWVMEPIPKKRIWLNVPFFLARAAIYFTIWITLAHMRKSISRSFTCRGVRANRSAAIHNSVCRLSPRLPKPITQSPTSVLMPLKAV